MPGKRNTKANPTDEERIVALIRERLAMGAKTYGPFQLATDKRNLPSEAIAEFLDATIYLAAQLVRWQDNPPLELPDLTAKLEAMPELPAWDDFGFTGRK